MLKTFAKMKDNHIQKYHHNRLCIKKERKAIYTWQLIQKTNNKQAESALSHKRKDPQQ